jgi:hypothetical protein
MLGKHRRLGKYRMNSIRSVTVRKIRVRMNLLDLGTARPWAVGHRPQPARPSP